MREPIKGSTSTSAIRSKFGIETTNPFQKRAIVAATRFGNLLNGRLRNFFIIIVIVIFVVIIIVVITITIVDTIVIIHGRAAALSLSIAFSTIALALASGSGSKSSSIGDSTTTRSSHGGSMEPMAQDRSRTDSSGDKEDKKH
jgi:uncharacterized membrane protein YgcG